jgi:flavin reductase (DIM6/NTAB) family NADH-FMN oxidoreductase RutF
MEITPSDWPHQSIYKLMIGSIVPRPIGWISSLDPEGRPNLAPYSFFNAVCPKPPTVLFCPQIRGSDGHPKDTLHNVRATGEFVVNIVSEAIAEAMNATSAEVAHGVDEFSLAGLTAVASKVVSPPRVGESVVHYECRVTQIVEISDQPGGGSIVIGEVLHIHVDDSVLIGTDKIDPDKLQAIGRLAGTTYTRTTDLFDMIRPQVQR